MAKLRPENVIKNLDNLGRITLPKGLRDRFFLKENSELELYTIEIDGRLFICMAPPKDVRLMLTKELLDEMKIPVPEAIKEQLEDKG